MKKNRINAFTLVEMLIVIVIIGILIAALMPRMQAAQGRARDVSRKTALSQVQSAIVTSQGDNGIWPGQCETNAAGCAQDGTGLFAIETDLKTAGMNSVPQDPLKSSDVWGLGNYKGTVDGDYAYIVTKRNGTENGGFVLMAKTEVEGGSNRVVCPTDETNGCTAKANQPFDINDNNGCIPGNNLADITEIHPCGTLKKIDDDDTTTQCHIDDSSNTCYYKSDGQLRYIVLY